MWYAAVTWVPIWLPGFILMAYVLSLVPETKGTNRKLLLAVLAVLSFFLTPIVPLMTVVILMYRDEPITRGLFNIAIISEAAFEASIQVVTQVRKQCLALWGLH